jgi:hypothetical protein
MAVPATATGNETIILPMEKWKLQNLNYSHELISACGKVNHVCMMRVARKKLLQLRMLQYDYVHVAFEIVNYAWLS